MAELTRGEGGDDNQELFAEQLRFDRQETLASAIPGLAKDLEATSEQIDQLPLVEAGRIMKNQYALDISVEQGENPKES